MSSKINLVKTEKYISSFALLLFFNLSLDEKVQKECKLHYKCIHYYCTGDGVDHWLFRRRIH